MPINLVLLAALVAGNWHCEKLNGLWECRAPSAIAPAAETSPAAETYPQGAQSPEPVQGSSVQEFREEAVPEPGPRQEPEPGPSVAAEPESPGSVPGPLPVVDEAAYVVQVGAFRSEESARQQAERIADRRLIIMPTRRDGEDWYVLLLGAYSSWQEADAVGRAFEESSGGSYWVRNAAALQRMLRTDRSPE